MPQHQLDLQILGPWSLATSRRFWEGFSPSALADQPTDDVLRAAFRVDQDWSRATVEVRQNGQSAQLALTGDGDLDAAAEQVARFLAIDVDGSGWPDVGRRDPVMERVQRDLPGLRPCGFYSPYEAAAWSVLSQRVRIVQAASMAARIVDEHGDGGAFPAPETLRSLDLDLPGRKLEYLHAVAGAALDGLLSGSYLRSLAADDALAEVREIKGVGPFAAELIVLRGANAPDAMPRNERRLNDEIAERYGPARKPEEIAQAWRPYRTWAAVHLRAAREARTGEIAG